jgi:hypothetical protein
MTAQMQLALMRVMDPRFVRVALLGLAVLLTVLTAGGADTVYACPAQGGSGGCSGG